jgi:hypothetical protein
MKLNKILLLTMLGLGLSLTTTQTVRGSQMASKKALVCKNLPKTTQGSYQACSSQSNAACCNAIISAACQGQAIQNNATVKNVCGAAQQQALSELQTQYPEVYNTITQGQQSVKGGTAGQGATGSRIQNLRSQFGTQSAQ